MQGMGAWLNLTSRQIHGAALIAALLLHGLLFASRLDFDTTKPETTETSLKLTLKTDPPAKPKEDQPPAREPEAENDLTKPEPPTPLQPSTATVLSKTPEPSQQSITVPSINSDVFKEFLRAETNRAISENTEAATEFADTFTPPSNPKLPNIKRDTGPLGGGSYKVRQNGVECESLVMVPQTFDQLTQGTISTMGKCKDLKKKFDLLDEDGKIKNSDRYDW